MTKRLRGGQLLALAGATALIVGACTAPGDDKTQARTAATGAEGLESGLLAAWVPADATDITVLQRTTGDERLLQMTYTGELGDGCTPIATTGAPTPEELERSYAEDPKTRDLDLSDLTTAPTLQADWWPQDQVEATSSLCGRWWVSADGDTVYAFAPEQTQLVPAGA